MTFCANGQSLGSATLQNGSASLTLSTLPPGTDNITADYFSNTPLLANSVSTAVTQTVDAVLAADAATGEAVNPASVVTDMRSLRMWAWLMLGLGEDPNRGSGQPDFAPDALGSGSYLPSQPVFNQSAAGLGSNRKGTPSAGKPSRDGFLVSENRSNPRPALEDDDDSAEDSGDPAILDEPPDIAVLDQL